jgi:hypothetical protein
MPLNYIAWFLLYYLSFSAHLFILKQTAMQRTAHPQGPYMQTGQQVLYGSQYAQGSQGQSMYGESQAMGYQLGSGKYKFLL